MFGILGWMLFGLVIGAVAKLVMPGRDPGGIIVTMLLGIVGAVVGGFVGRAMGLYQPGEPAGFFMATLGAIVLLFIYRLAFARSKTTI
ncbi:MAG TPA: GlsB/YeaQ/YmgE family stress response membrane protein [Vicinamibacterales bacterium]|jgi:uncharacterized membrane protein YeaQ/YmgE (transglycosylase-associated protein family)|nr:GlsB/YeaQ/YmgE family stress response membrane protein [Vicinamibacterales bacterium]